MTKSKTEIQRDWMQRLYARADLFDQANESRQRALQKIMRGDPCGPEEIHARRFFIAHPRCGDFPSVTIEDGQLVAGFGERTDYHDIAAFIIAVREVSSIGVRVEFFGDGWGGAYSEINSELRPFADRIESEAEQLRARGLWGA